MSSSSSSPSVSRFLAPSRASSHEGRLTFPTQGFSFLANRRKTHLQKKPSKVDTKQPEKHKQYFLRLPVDTFSHHLITGCSLLNATSAKLQPESHAHVRTLVHSHPSRMKEGPTSRGRQERTRLRGASTAAADRSLHVKAVITRAGLPITALPANPSPPSSSLLLVSSVTNPHYSN